MGIADVVAQKRGVTLEDVAAAADGAAETNPEGANGPAPSVSFSIGGTDATITVQELTLLGVLVADLLLVYIALGV